MEIKDRMELLNKVYQSALVSLIDEINEWQTDDVEELRSRAALKLEGIVDSMHKMWYYLFYKCDQLNVKIKDKDKDGDISQLETHHKDEKLRIEKDF